MEETEEKLDDLMIASLT